MDKEAQEALENARSSLSSAASSAGDKISDFIEGAKPHIEKHKNPLLAALIGAIAGGTGAGMADGSILGGAALGGLAGGATGVGLDMLQGKTLLPGEEDVTPLTTKVLDKTTSEAIGNVGALTGAGAGAMASRRYIPTDSARRAFVTRGAQGLVEAERDKVLEHLRKGDKPLKELIKTVSSTGAKAPGWLKFLSLPAAGLGAGHLVDRYIQGDY